VNKLAQSLRRENPEQVIARLQRLQRERLAELDKDRAQALENSPPAVGTLPSWEARDPETGRAVTMTYETTRYQREVWQDNARFARKMAKLGVIEVSSAQAEDDAARQAAREAARVARQEKGARTRAENAARKGADKAARALAAARADKARLPRPDGGFSPTTVARRKA